MNKFGFILAFFKRNFFPFVCLFLFFLVLLTGSFSYAKYISSNSQSHGSDVGSFSVSASIDNVSGFSFTNTSFWSNTTDNNKIAMNALRTLKFSINNFKKDNNNNIKISDVKLKYDLTFSSPEIFARKFAFQVFDENDNPIIPQIVLEDLLTSESIYNTTSSKDYNGTDTEDLEFSVLKNRSSYSATSKDITITISEYEKTVSQTLLFRMWDTSSITTPSNPEVNNDGGEVVPPVEVTYTTKVKFYRISIKSDKFVLPAGKMETDKYSIKLAPTDVIPDDYLGGKIVDKVTDSNGNITYNKINEIYGGDNKIWYLQSLKEQRYDAYYDNPDFTGDPIKTTELVESTVVGSATIYKEGATSPYTEKLDSESIGKQEVIETNEVKKSDIIWNDIKIPDSESQKITKDNYNSNYYAKAVREKNEYGTIFYIHKLNATRTGTQTIEYINTKKTITPTSKVSKETEVSENSVVQKVDDKNENISLNITKKTVTKYTGNMKIETVTTTTTVTRTITETGFIYRGYYLKSGNTLDYWGSTGIENDLKQKLIEINETATNEYLTENKFSIEKLNVEKESYSDVKSSPITETSTENNVTESISTNYEYFQRNIKRYYTYNDIKIEKVFWSKNDENNNTLKIEYDSNNKLNFYDNNGLQILYLSQCYSKSYPFFVNVMFEQEQ